MTRPRPIPVLVAAALGCATPAWCAAQAAGAADPAAKVAALEAQNATLREALVANRISAMARWTCAPA